ncbi:type II secretion system protein [Sulfurimonas sp.]|uniref:type IV pilus modification PilV family protein n=1 Tax=Sulfurimonas sp. TaxID=2022749 RepID=UPI0025CEE48C|nr:type II secretion system protein [Sulfurimonas sp.]MCK9472283.1 type II secretion system GspH family protein [Sulfurimonas sp.]
MVRRKTTLGRFAFTMIELIFAIVVISIVVMSLPMMMQTTSKGIEDSIVQEAVFAASAELMEATTYYWDNNRSIEDFDISRYSRVVDVDGNCNATTRQRPGHVNRRCLDSNVGIGVNYTNAEATGLGLNRSVHGVDLFDESAAEASGYKQEYKSKISIKKGLNSNDVKELNASIYKNDGTTLLTSLKIYSANIGEVAYHKRRF